MKLPEGMEVLLIADPADHDLWVRLVEVTPKTAKKWLAFNHKHRDINPKKVAQYAKTMKAGDWVVNGKTIVFDYEGKLVGGQHRLSGCVKSGRPFLALVVCGVDPTAVERDEPDEKPAKKARKTEPEVEVVYSPSGDRVEFTRAV